MGMKIWIPAAAAIACTGALLSMPAWAHSSGGGYPYAPSPHYGQVWVPGHWEWQGNRHVWVHGQYLHGGAAYHGQHYNHYNYYRGRRDLDNDGVRNRHDRDRDGDGVPNWHDRAPNNRYRR